MGTAQSAAGSSGGSSWRSGEARYEEAAIEDEVEEMDPAAVGRLFVDANNTSE